MSVLDAVNKGKATNLSAREKYLAKQFSRPVSISGLLQFMAEQLKLNGYGPLTPITKQNKNKINGFIKFLRNNSFSDQEIYEFIKECVEKWEELASIDIYTDNRKKYTLDTIPNIVDIVHCKSQIFNELNKEKEDTEDMDIFTAWGNM